MKTFFLAAIAAFSLAAATVPAANATSTIAGDKSATFSQQTGGFSGGGD